MVSTIGFFPHDRYSLLRFFLFSQFFFFAFQNDPIVFYYYFFFFFGCVELDPVIVGVFYLFQRSWLVFCCCVSDMDGKDLWLKGDESGDRVLGFYISVQQVLASIWSFLFSFLNCIDLSLVA